MKEPTLPEKETSVFAAIGAGIAGLLVFVALFAGFYRDETPAWDGARMEAPALANNPPADGPDWTQERGLNLPPLGALPSLQTAMRNNPALRRLVDDFSKKDDAAIFAGYRQTDADIANILLLWAGADLTDTALTREGMDGRIALFLRQAYLLGGLESVVNNPRMGRNPWPRLFAHYKARLIAQTPGGQMPFTKGVRYDIGSDRLALNEGGLSRAFFAQFGAFIRSQPDAAAYRANLLAYVNAVDAGAPDAEPGITGLIQ